MRLRLDAKLVQRICRGDAEAMAFLADWGTYCHEIDDIIDGERPEPEAILETFAKAPLLFSHPFYLKHLAELRPVVLHVTATYAQTVAWEQSPDWRSEWADHHRHCSNDMAQAVALICGGYSHARQVIPELRVMAYHEHHTENGAPK